MKRDRDVFDGSRISAASILLLSCLVLTACGSSSSASPSVARQSAFTSEQPTQPVTTPAILAPALPTPKSLGLNETILTPYTHASQTFSIMYPEGWQVFEREDGVVFVDLSGQVAYSILFRRVETTPDQDRLNRFARQFVAENFGDEPNFTWLSDEAGRLRFKSLDPNIGSSINQVTFSHQETLVYLSMITALEEYWDEAEAWLQEFADTLVKSDPVATGPVHQLGCCIHIQMNTLPCYIPAIGS